MPFSLSTFERIDGLRDRLARMGDFLTCADPRGYIHASNRLFDACVDAGMAPDEDDHEEWANAYVVNALVSA
jgi:hypothetical protein